MFIGTITEYGTHSHTWYPKSKETKCLARLCVSKFEAHPLWTNVQVKNQAFLALISSMIVAFSPKVPCCISATTFLQYEAIKTLDTLRSSASAKPLYKQSSPELKD
jgi:hypothetical protein